MSYDLEPAERAKLPSFPAADPRDLEALVTLLELAAICLTQEPDSTFTADQLIAESRKIAGDEFKFDETDLRIVLANAGFLKRSGRGSFQLK